jgi:hypothetical protein
MHNAVIMDVLQSRAELPSAFESFFNAKLASLLEELFDRSAADDFHAVKQPVAIEAVVVARDNVWVIKLVQNLDFPLEPLADRFILRNGRLQNLQSNLSLARPVNGSADRAHGADAKRFAKLK